MATRRQDLGRTVVGAAVQAVSLGTLPAAGAAVTFQVRLTMTRQDAAGQMGAYFAPEGDGARNATGSGFVTAILIGPTGYTDAVAVPWTTIAGLPVGWGTGVALVGANLQLQWNAAAGETVESAGYAESWYKGGATV